MLQHLHELAPLTVFCKGGSPGGGGGECHPDMVLRPRSRLGPGSTDRLGTLAGGANASAISTAAAAALARFRIADRRFGANWWRVYPFVRSGFDRFDAWLAYTVGRRLAHWLLLHAADGEPHGGWFAAESKSLQRFPRLIFEAITVQQRSPNEEVQPAIAPLRTPPSPLSRCYPPSPCLPLPAFHRPPRGDPMCAHESAG